MRLRPRPAPAHRDRTHRHRLRRAHPVRAPDAEDYLSGALAGAGLWEDPRPLPEAVRRRFAELAATACRPIDDVRGTARYRVHAVGVLARRTLDRTWDAYTKGLTPCA